MTRLLLLALALCGAALPGATLTVTSSADTGAGSLRSTLAAATAGDEIVFDSSISTITLASELAIGINVTITGRGIGVLTLSGNNVTRIFNITAGTVVIRDMTVINAMSTQFGSAVNAGGGNVTVQRCAFSNCVCNTTAFDGGTLRVAGTGTVLTVRDCTITNCSNIASGGACGGIWLGGGSALIERTSITGCLSSRATAIGIAGSATNCIVRFCTIANNTSNQTRASIYSQTGAGHILENCTVVNNTATTSQGGLYLLSGTWTVRNCTLLNNSHEDYRGTASVTMSNTILGLSATAVTSAGRNICRSGGGSGWVASDMVGSTAAPINLLLGALANNGGPTQTMLPQAGSPAINFVTGTAPDLDQRGLVRLGATFDCGAAEVDSAGPFSVTPAFAPWGSSILLTGQQMTEITAVTVGGIAGGLGTATATTLSVTVAGGTPVGPFQTIQITANGKTQNWLFVEVSSGPAPEIQIFDAATGGTSLNDPATVGGVNVGNLPTTLTFRIENQASATADLVLPAAPVTFNVTAGAGTVNVNVTQPATLTLPPGTSATFTVSISATAAATGGAYTVELDVASNDTNENPFDINVSGISDFNNAPRANPDTTTSAPIFTGTADIGPFTFAADPGAAVASKVIVDDADGDDVQVVQITPSAAQAGIAATATAGFSQAVDIDFTGTLDANAPPGVYTWTIDLQDDQTPAATRQIIVTITLNNLPPDGFGNAAAGVSGDGVAPGTAYAISFMQTQTVASTALFTVTDANLGQTLAIVSQSRTGGTGATTFPFSGQFALSGAAGSFSVDISTAGALVGTDVGTHEHEILIEDGVGGNQITVFVILTVTAQTPPTFTAAATPASTGQGGTLTNVSVGTVADGQDAPTALQVTATTVPAGITVSAIAISGTGDVTCTIAASAASATGNLSIVFTVTDTALLTGAGAFNLVVAANTPPSVVPVPAFSMFTGVTLTNHAVGTVTDLEQAAGTLLVSVQSPSPDINVSGVINAGGTIRVNLTTSPSAAPATHTLTLQVADNIGVIATTSLNVTVTAGLGAGEGGGGGGCQAAPVAHWQALCWLAPLAMLALWSRLRRKTS